MRYNLMESEIDFQLGIVLRNPSAATGGNPKLEAALPISADIAALAGIALDAMAAIES
jgi:hypothetical protein